VNATIIGGGGGGASGSGIDTGPTLAGGQGAAGIVIARYKGTSAGTGGSVTVGTGTAAGYTLHTFTSTGTSALDLSSLNLSTRLGAVENGVISGSGDLTFTGPGTLTLNATNTYSGTTRVNAGTLVLGSSGSIGNSAGVSLASGASFNVSTVSGGFILGATQNLSGGGTITGNTIISGTHTPGFSPGVQTFENNLSYTAGSSAVWELIDDSLAGRGTNYDGINVGGNLSFSGATTLTLDFDLAGSAVDWSDSLWSSDITGNAGWKIYDVTGTISGFQNLQLASINWLDGQGDAFTSARPDASFSLFQGTDGIYLNYSAVPEPSAALLGGLGMLALLRRRR
jgi:autotransporter-associated beta strand protein